MDEYLFPDMNRETLPITLETLALDLATKLGTEEFSRDDLITFAKTLHAVTSKAIKTGEDRLAIKDMVKEIFTAAKQDMGRISDKDISEASGLAKEFFMAVSTGISTTLPEKSSPEAHKAAIKSLGTLGSFMPASDLAMISQAISTLLPPHMKAIMSDSGVLADDIYAAVRKEFEMATNEPDTLAGNRAQAAQYLTRKDFAGEFLKARNQVTPEAIKKLVAYLADNLDPDAAADMVVNILETTADIAKSVVDTGGSPKISNPVKALQTVIQIKDFLTVLENSALATGLNVDREAVIKTLNGYITRARGEYQAPVVTQETSKPTISPR